MKLQVAIQRLGAVDHVVLLDEHGERLPCQRKAVLVSPHDDVAEVTVTFLIDGKHVAMLASQAAAPPPSGAVPDVPPQ